MYHRSNRIHQAATITLAALSLLATVRADDAAGTAPSQSPTKNAVDLGKVEVRGDNEQPNVLPTLPTNSLYGYEQTIKDTPRSVFKVSKDQLDEDVIQNYNDLSHYSPSVQRSTSSPYSTFANIRGGSADTMRNGILLLNPAVRPFDNNSWESADIVAGVPSVAFGSTTRTAGFVNYITKQPYYDKQHTEITTTFGRLGTNSDTTYGQYSVQVDTGAPIIKDELAYRVSVQVSKADTYWAISKANFYDFYGAVNYKPFKNLTIDANFTYTKSDGPYPYGINRVTPDLIDNWTYLSGPTSPILKSGSTFYRANNSGTFDAGSVANGVFVPNGTSTAATWTKSSPANLVGWVLLPANAKPVTINGSQTLYNKDSFSDAHEYIGQVVSALTLNDTFTLRNNSLFQYSKSFVYGYDEYYSFMVNKLVASRIELVSNSEFKLFNTYVTHKSNSGFDFRNLWNYCDNVGKPSERPFSNADATDPGTLGVAYSLGLTSIYPAALDGSNGVYVPEQTKYGWINIAPGYLNSEGRVQGLSINALGGGDVRINQLSTFGVYSEHNFDIGEAWSLRAGARLTRIQDYLRGTPQTYTVAGQGLLPSTLPLSDNDTAWNGDFNTSLTYRPTKWATTYITYDNDRASADCGCCLTSGFQSFGGYNQGLEHSYFTTVSQLYEAGGKFEVIQNKLFVSVAAFHQTREVPSVPTASNPSPVQVGLLYRGVEANIIYQPNRHFSVGGNYAYLHSTYRNQSAASVYSDYNGFVPDGVTIVNNSTGSVGANSSVRGNYRALGTPLHSINAWTSYQFDSGFGVKFDAWVTTDWQVSRIVWVPTQRQYDAGVFYAIKSWRADLTFHNITDQKNWSPSGNYAGGSTGYLLPGERFGVTGRFSYKF